MTSFACKAIFFFSSIPNSGVYNSHKFLTRFCATSALYMQQQSTLKLFPKMSIDEIKISNKKKFSSWPPYLIPNKTTKKFTIKKNCCKSFHKKGDDHFSDLLNKEIQNEKENMLKVPPPSDGWSLDQTEANCLLSKGTACERINVKFNINQSISAADYVDRNEGHLIADPDFDVEFHKISSSHVITFSCYFTVENFGEEDHLHNYAIKSIQVHHGHIENSTYVIDAQCVDANFYHHMLMYLDERGINQKLTDEIIRIATAVENQEYITSLVRLNVFVRGQ